MNLPESLKVTESGEPWMVLDKKLGMSEDDECPRTLGFASSSGLDILRNSKVWHGDGTFDGVSSTLFSQVWIIIAVTNTGASVPCAFFLLPNKETPTYKDVLSCLVENNIPSPDKLYLDFEAATARAVRETYPEIDIIGCDAHFKRNLRENLR